MKLSCISNEMVPLVLILAIASGQVHAEGPQSPNGAAAAPLVDPFFLLIQDDAVRQALNFDDSKRRAVDEVLQKHNHLLLAIRDVGPQGAPPDVAANLQPIRQSLLQLLDENQRARLAGLVFQAQSYNALVRGDLADDLKIVPHQQQQLEEFTADFQAQVKQLTESGGMTDEDRQQAVNKARVERHQRVLSVLDERQKRLWAERLGEPFDFAKVRSSPGWAPEFVDVEQWINSPPLTLKSLRGRVVVVHFFAFGCINCIQNYPWYRQWYEELPSAEVSIIGIHTPETAAESSVASLEKKLHENNLKFPVAVDNQKKNWRAWSNSMWPSVYLIDKKGRLRYWWYGELDWQGAGGHKLARQRIDELLAETP
jgi:peroxiredoxin